MSGTKRKADAEAGNKKRTRYGQCFVNYMYFARKISFYGLKISMILLVLYFWRFTLVVRGEERYFAHLCQRFKKTLVPFTKKCFNFSGDEEDRVAKILYASSGVWPRRKPPINSKLSNQLIEVNLSRTFSYYDILQDTNKSWEWVRSSQILAFYFTI